MQEDITMIKKVLLNPDNGTVSRVNKNTDFRKSTGKVLWSLWIAVLGIIGKIIFWN
jgi:DNA-binding winged helix-turn-helix (wHTH) protein